MSTSFLVLFLEEQIYWAFRNVERGYYLGATADGVITCQAKMPQSRGELWHVHLIPARGATMFALKSVGRRRYARSTASTITPDAGANMEQIQMDGATPWGPETLFQFKYFEGGRYALLTSSRKYLNSEGACVDWTSGKVVNGNGNANGFESKGTAFPSPDLLFNVEYHGGHVAFRDYQGRYLASTGRSSILRSRSSNVSRDELFEMETAPIQVAFRANSNHKWVSIKQGELLIENRLTLSDH